MPFSYPTVEINSIIYTTYASEADADQYLLANIAATNWQAIPASDHLTKGRALVSATRWLDVQQWQGQLADVNQGHAWPRTGLTDPYTGLVVDSAALPTAIVAGDIELANALVDDPSLMTTLHQAFARELHAGAAGITFFRPTGDVQVTTPLPTLVMNIVGRYLQGTVSGPVSKGTHEKSRLEHPFDFSHGL